MLHETINTSHNSEAPRTQSRRELIKDIGAFTAKTVISGSVLGVLAAEGKQKIEIHNQNRAYEERVGEIESLFPYIDSLCDNPDQIPWIPDSREEGIAIYSEIGFSEYYAEQAGLELLNTEEALFAVEHATSVNEVIEAFDVLTRQFGAESTLADNWQFPNISQEERATYYANYSDIDILKYRFTEMIGELRHIPKELFEASGVTNIHFTEFASSNIKTESGAKTVTHGQAWFDGEGRMALSLDNVYAGYVNEFTLLHEIGHLLDESLSGGASLSYNDTYFDDLNEPDFEYLRMIPDKLEAEGFVRAYSTYSIWEDKAVIFENILSGVDFSLARSEDPILRKKYRLQLARLEHAVPNSAPYLVMHGYDSDSTPRNPYGAFGDTTTVALV